MAAYDGYRVKDRSAKVARRRRAMPVNGRGVFAVLAVVAKKGRAAAARKERRNG